MFWFRVLIMCYLRMAVMHLPTNSQLLTFSEIQDGDRHHLGAIFGFTPKIYGHIVEPPKSTPLSGSTRFEPSLVQI